MFRCDICGKVQEPRVREERLVVEKRKKKYFHEGKISEGFETVKELKICRKCLGEEYDAK